MWLEVERVSGTVGNESRDGGGAPMVWGLVGCCNDFGHWRGLSTEAT